MKMDAATKDEDIGEVEDGSGDPPGSGRDGEGKAGTGRGLREEESGIFVRI
jgi:hypothetical protein